MRFDEMRINDKKKFIIISFLFFSISVGLYSVKGEGMSLFGKGEKVCLFSGFDGKITLKGEPASGAKIIRKAQWMDGVDPESEELTTNEQGEFSFKSLWVVDSRKFVSQFASSQEIWVIYKDEKYRIWGGGKLGIEELEEFSYKKPKNLKCELTDELEYIQLVGSFVRTSCKWTVDE